MKLSELQNAGFNKDEARIISEYAKAGEAGPVVNAIVSSVKTLFRTISWLTLGVVVLYVLTSL